MAIDLALLRRCAPPPFAHRYAAKDTILYALALGLGDDASDTRHLPFVYEAGLHALPTMALVLGDPGFWLQDPAAGVDWPRVLYGEVSVDWHDTVPAHGEVLGTTHVDGLIDPGPGKASLLHLRREVTHQAAGQRLCTVKSIYVCRADAAPGGQPRQRRTAESMPSRPPDESVLRRTLPQAALLYRLTGDRNPLHADTEVARSAGFARPILHGLCSFGIAGFALLQTLCADQVQRVRHMSARFTSPVYPGETLLTEVWHDGGGRAVFRCTVPEREQVVLSSGRFDYA